MVMALQIAEAAEARDAMRLRILIQDWLAENPRISAVPAPQFTDATRLSILAGIIELIALRRGQTAPSWVHKIPAAPNPVFLVKAADTMPRLKQLCETESPLPLRRRNLFAPPGFLEFL
jgi:hypothetical protein